MLSKILLFAALSLTPLVAAHGRVDVVTGNAGGNGTAIGIKGGVVPLTGPNSKTEVDTTVFGGRTTNIATDGLGRTTGGGKNTVAMAAQAMALSGNTLPQVTPGGSIKGTFHVVTTDGAGPIQAVLDPTATGKFSAGMPLTVVQQIAGKNGNIAATRTNGKAKGKAGKGARALLERALSVILRRAANVNRSFDFEFALPAGATCSGAVAGQQNVCLVKIANSNRAGPFGGVVAVQMAAAAAGGGSSNATADGAGAGAGAGQKAQGAQKAKAGAGKGKTAREFTA